MNIICCPSCGHEIKVTVEDRGPLGASVPRMRSRRGRKPGTFTDAQRAGVSDRMKRYWAGRRGSTTPLLGEVGDCQIRVSGPPKQAGGTLDPSPRPGDGS